MDNNDNQVKEIEDEAVEEGGGENLVYFESESEKSTLPILKKLSVRYGASLCNFSLFEFEY